MGMYHCKREHKIGEHKKTPLSFTRTADCAAFFFSGAGRSRRRGFRETLALRGVEIGLIFLTRSSSKNPVRDSPIFSAREISSWSLDGMYKRNRADWNCTVLWKYQIMMNAHSAKKNLYIRKSAVPQNQILTSIPPCPRCRLWTPAWMLVALLLFTGGLQSGRVWAPLLGAQLVSPAKKKTAMWSGQVIEWFKLWEGAKQLFEIGIWTCCDFFCIKWMTDTSLYLKKAHGYLCEQDDRTTTVIKYLDINLCSKDDRIFSSVSSLGCWYRITQKSYL